mmetsp:Transcript_44010/g.95638  ORF Transcript_44010/g.95638 Transcript_44010/m.95638 type:complete len:203 (-) Transcript_44010:868-1476(-)
MKFSTWNNSQPHTRPSSGALSRRKSRRTSKAFFSSPGLSSGLEKYRSKAISRGVLPYASATFSEMYCGEGPQAATLSYCFCMASTKHGSNCQCPIWHARCRGVKPRCRSALRRAPSCSKAVTRRREPLSTAANSGVQLSAGDRASTENPCRVRVAIIRSFDCKDPLLRMTMTIGGSPLSSDSWTSSHINMLMPPAWSKGSRS